VLSQFLAELDGIEELRGVLVLGATNRLDMLDPAVIRPGRFDQIVEIPLPKEEDRREIFSIHLKNKPLAPGIDLSALVASSDAFSGAEIASVCNVAALRAVRRAIEGIDPAGTEEVVIVVTADDLQAAFEEVDRG
jgi:transitional endoplasmic reticulum ATPase